MDGTEWKIFKKLQEEANEGFGGVEEDHEDNFGKI
jgi:hypothetical protein